MKSPAKPTRRRKITSLNSYAVETNTPQIIILEIEGDVLSFRHKGSRKRYQIGIERVMQEAIIDAAAHALERTLLAPDPEREKAKATTAEIQFPAPEPTPTPPTP